MGSCFVIALAEGARPLASRDDGRRLKAQIRAAMATFGHVVVDFGGAPVTPSLADECFGALAEEMGLSEFRERVRSKNVSPKARALLSHVIKQRLQGP